MRIASLDDLKKLQNGKEGKGPGEGMAPAVRAQLENAFSVLEKERIDKASRSIKAAKSSSNESAGEAWLRIALTAEFGDWFEGGEVVCELQPFKNRKFRADIALPRWFIYGECDGWNYHGRHLSDHHDDRLRAMYFSRFNWLPFRVSHSQAKNNLPELIDSIKSAMTYRQPLPRSELTIVKHKHASGYRCTMTPMADDFVDL